VSLFHSNDLLLSLAAHILLNGGMAITGVLIRWLEYIALLLLYGPFSLCYFSAWQDFIGILPGQSAPDLSVIGRPFGASVNVQIAGADIDRPLRDFANQFNDYVHVQNSTSHLENMAAMSGYLLAGLTALLSLYLEVMAVRDKNHAIGNDRSA
jgi:hypothetical protein